MPYDCWQCLTMFFWGDFTINPTACWGETQHHLSTASWSHLVNRQAPLTASSENLKIKCCNTNGPSSGIHFGHFWDRNKWGLLQSTEGTAYLQNQSPATIKPPVRSGLEHKSYWKRWAFSAWISHESDDSQMTSVSSFFTIHEWARVNPWETIAVNINILTLAFIWLASVWTDFSFELKRKLSTFQLRGELHKISHISQFSFSVSTS